MQRALVLHRKRKSTSVAAERSSVEESSVREQQPKQWSEF